MHSTNKKLLSTSIEAVPPFISISGIYPHLSVWNHEKAVLPKPEPECGIGAVIPWAGKLWLLTYTSHELGEGHDKLFCINPDKTIQIAPESVGGTHASRFIHKPTNQLFIGCYVINSKGEVKSIDRKKLPGRLSAIATHLTDPENKIYYYTQECSLFEVDVHTLEPILLFHKAIPGWHSKGAYTSQNVVVVSHNGEEPAPSPYWKVDYSNLDKVSKEVEKYLKTEISYGPDKMGVLAEYDGKDWTVISRKQHVEVMGPGGISGGAPTGEAPIWATGWDHKSVLMQVRYKGKWKTYRLAKGSYTYDGYNGSFTEWPRIRKLDNGSWMMTMHGTFYQFPEDFKPGKIGGLRPISTYQRYIPDFCSWEDQLVLAGQDASRHGLSWAVAGHSHSNIQFTTKNEIEHWGPCSGYGGVWLNESVEKDSPSDPFLLNGHTNATLHISHHSEEELTITLEADFNGNEEWVPYKKMTIPANGYSWLHLEPVNDSIQWIRLRLDKTCEVSAYFHLQSDRKKETGEESIFIGLAPITNQSNKTNGLLRIPQDSHNLVYLSRFYNINNVLEKEVCYEVNEKLVFNEIKNAASRKKEVQETCPLAPQATRDKASIIMTGADGRRFRLPYSSHNNLRNGELLSKIRDIREVVQERYLANLGGTFYEVPRLGVAFPVEQRNLPDYSRMRPIASHPYEISDFTIWRGLLVLAGVSGKVNNPHMYYAPKDEAGLWFGAFDDLWKLGDPVGFGGPWQDTPVAAGVPSDPYLMTGFKNKKLTLSHLSRKEVTFTIETDFTGNNIFSPYTKITVPRGETAHYTFPEHFNTHWVRMMSDLPTVATAFFEYGKISTESF